MLGFDAFSDDDCNENDTLILGLKVRSGFGVVFVLSPNTDFVLGDGNP
jgi:hypothetical protein